MNRHTGDAAALFAALSRIPHPSGHEAALRAEFVRRLTALGGVCETDTAGNLRSDLPAAPGREGEPRLCFQGHLDMVWATAPGSSREPLRDGIVCVTDGDTLRSDRTTSLGADNLLAVCALTCLLEAGVSHGPLRLLLTVREEQGLAGAREVPPLWLENVAALLNLDGFVSRRCIVGSAGGVRETRQRETALRDGTLPGWRVTLFGYPGGHSGFDIARAGENPIRVLAEVLARADVALCALNGGGALNAIPAGAEAVVRTASPAALEAALHALVPAGQYRLTPEANPGAVFGDAERQALLDFLLALPVGVLNWRTDLPNVPAASTNLASVRTEGERVTVGLFHRGSPAVVLERTARGAALHAERCGFRRTLQSSYAPWEGSPESPLARAVARCWARANGGAFELTAVHVGLEPAVLLEQHPGLPAVSLGTDIRNAHSVREEASLAGLSLLLNLLEALLGERELLTDG